MELLNNMTLGGEVTSQTYDVLQFFLTPVSQ